MNIEKISRILKADGYSKDYLCGMQTVIFSKITDRFVQRELEFEVSRANREYGNARSFKFSFWDACGKPMNTELTPTEIKVIQMYLTNTGGR